MLHLELELKVPFTGEKEKAYHSLPAKTIDLRSQAPSIDRSCVFHFPCPTYYGGNETLCTVRSHDIAQKVGRSLP